MVATTIETLRFDRPETVAFRLLRGPVPHVVERLTLHDDSGSTRLDYLGELGTDFWQLGRWCGDQVTRKWEATVWGSLVSVRDEAERGTARAQGPERAMTPGVARAVSGRHRDGQKERHRGTG